MADAIPRPPPGFTLDTIEPPAKGNAPPPPPPGFRLDTPPPASAPSEKKPDAKPGMMERLWDTLTKPSGETAAGRFKMGIGDPAMGLAQIASRQYISPVEGGEIDIGPEQTSKAADTMAQQREARYQEQRRQATPGANDPEARMVQPSLATDWARLGGNIASPVNLLAGAAIPPGAGAAPAAGLASRMISAMPRAAAQGAVGGALQPTGPDDSRLANATLGAAGGAVAGPLATAAGTGIRSGLNRAFGRDPEQALQREFSKGVGISPKGIQNAPDLANARNNATEAVKLIAGNKDNLTLTTPGGGEVTGRLPVNRQQFSEAVDQTKEAIFKKFDAASKGADASTVGLQMGPINKFNKAYGDALAAKTEAQSKLMAENRSLQILMGEDAKGVAVDPKLIGQRQKLVNKLSDQFTRATRDVDAAGKNLTRPWVDLKPISAELQKFSSDPVVAKINPSVAEYAAEKMRSFGEQEAFTASQAQRAIKYLNASLKAFYDNPSYDNAARASVDAMIANKMRQALDKMVEGATGAQYQALKNQYGSLSAIEKQVTRGALKAQNKMDQTYLDHFVNVSSAEEVLRGVLTMNPHAMTRGGLLYLARLGQRWFNSPDRAIARMFAGAERAAMPPGPSSDFTRGALSAGVGAALPAWSRTRDRNRNIIDAPPSP